MVASDFIPTQTTLVIRKGKHYWLVLNIKLLKTEELDRSSSPERISHFYCVKWGKEQYVQCWRSRYALALTVFTQLVCLAMCQGLISIETRQIVSGISAFPCVTNVGKWKQTVAGSAWASSQLWWTVVGGQRGLHQRPSDVQKVHVNSSTREEILNQSYQSDYEKGNSRMLEMLTTIMIYVTMQL